VVVELGWEVVVLYLFLIVCFWYVEVDNDVFVCVVIVIGEVFIVLVVLRG